MIDYKAIKENTKDGVTIIYLPDRKLWGLQFNKGKAVFYSTFETIVRKMEQKEDNLNKKHGSR